MNKDISVTQASNLISFVGVVVLVLNHFKINITQDEVQAFLGAAITLVGIIVSFVNRYKKGDITLSGIKKTY
ncbi:MAG: hypothetical protein WBV94_08395 [Blastocatellia bacterium]